MYVVEGLYKGRKWFKVVETIDDVIEEVKYMKMMEIEIVRFKVASPNKPHSWWCWSNTPETTDT